MKPSFLSPVSRNGTRSEPRIIVSCDIGKHYPEDFLTTQRNCDLYCGDSWRLYYSDYPDGCPPHSERQYAFKVYAMEEAIRAGFRFVLWIDSSLAPLAPIGPLWKRIEQHGWYAAPQYSGITEGHPWRHWASSTQATLGQWCSDAALNIFGISRTESFSIPLALTGLVGLDMRHPTAQIIWRMHKEFYHQGVFNGAHVNSPGSPNVPAGKWQVPRPCLSRSGCARPPPRRNFTVVHPPQPGTTARELRLLDTGIRDRLHRPVCRPLQDSVQGGGGMRAVVNVSFGLARFRTNHARLEAILAGQAEQLLSWDGVLPHGSPTHQTTPYAFKAYALQNAALQGYQTLLWMDASVVPIQRFGKLWDLVERQGYWFSENLPHGSTGPCFTNGQWTSDAALAPLGISREESFTFPHVIATAFGLDLRHEIARRFLEEYLRLAKEGTAFQGQWSNHGGCLSSDPRVLGHRHDQTAASVIAWRLGMALTTPPAWIVDGIPATKVHSTGDQEIAPMLPEIITRVTPYTMTDEIRLTELVNQTGRLIAEQVPGVFVECGVWRGGSMMAVALALMHFGISDRELYLFDTFEGMTRPEPVDVDLYGQPALDEFERQKYREDRADWCLATLADAQANMASTGYPEERLHFIQGKVEDTLPDQAPPQIALLRLDTDWYASTLHELVHLFPRISQEAERSSLMTTGTGRAPVRPQTNTLQSHGITSPLVRNGYTAVTIVKDGHARL